MTYQEILKELKAKENQRNILGMARFGIKTKKIYGVPKKDKDSLAKRIGKNHEMASRLWDSGIYDARDIAWQIADAKLVTEEQMERWVKDFDNWAVCDGCLMHLFGDSKFAWKKAKEWVKREEEFVKRAGFAMVAVLASHDKEASDEKFIKFLPIIKKEAKDERLYVKKAVNWALRQIGKRNLNLNKEAIKMGEEIRELPSRSARWIASDALRELKNPKIKAMILRREKSHAKKK